MTLGIVAGWSLILLGISYYARRTIGAKRWRKLHRFTALAWLAGLVHALGMGTDAGQVWFLAMIGIVAIPALALLILRLSGGGAGPAARPAADARSTGCRPSHARSLPARGAVRAAAGAGANTPLGRESEVRWHQEVSPGDAAQRTSESRRASARCTTHPTDAAAAGPCGRTSRVRIGYRPGGCRTTNPENSPPPCDQRVPPDASATVSNRQPATLIHAWSALA